MVVNVDEVNLWHSHALYLPTVSYFIFIQC
jgi:hypothetical protein